jgi:hypothetical protein
MTQPVTSGKTRSFKIQPQKQDQWCWAAVAASIANYYDMNETQCSIANKCLGLTDCDCCKTPTPAECNKPHYLANPKGALEILGLEKKVFKQLPFAQLQKEDLDDCPVAIRVVWHPGAGKTPHPDDPAHFVVIVGAYDIVLEPKEPSSKVPFVAIADPWPAWADEVQLVSFAALNSPNYVYHGAGLWDYTVTTQRPPKRKEVDSES